MRIIKQFAALVSLTFFLPVAFVAASGFALSPFQAAAVAPAPRIVLEANDIPLAEEAGVAQGDANEIPPEEASGSVQDGANDMPLEEADDGALEGELLLSEEIAAYVESQVVPVAEDGPYSSDELRTRGVIFDGDYRYTWYSQRVLPGGGLAIDGRHVTDEGYVADSLGRIVVASSDLPYGTELPIPFGSGTGIVLDTGCAPGTIDVYTDY